MNTPLTWLLRAPAPPQRRRGPGGAAQLTPRPSETPFGNYTFTQVIKPNPMYVSCCWLIFNLKNISLRKEDAGGRVCCIQGLRGRRSSKWEAQRRRQVLKHHVGSGRTGRPVRASSIPDRYPAGPVLKWGPRGRCEEPLQMLYGIPRVPEPGELPLSIQSV